MGPYDLGRRRTRERQLLRSGWRKGPQPRGIRDAKARAERSVGHACLRRRTGSGTPQGSTGSDGSAGPRVLGRAQSSAAQGRIRGLPSSTRGRSRMDERPCPDLRGGCAVLRIPTVTGGRGSATTPPTRLPMYSPATSQIPESGPLNSFRTVSQRCWQRGVSHGGRKARDCWMRLRPAGRNALRCSNTRTAWTAATWKPLHGTNVPPLQQQQARAAGRPPGRKADAFAAGSRNRTRSRVRARQGQRSAKLKVVASKGGTLTGSSSLSEAISSHWPSRSSKASRPQARGSTNHSQETPSRA